MAASRPVPSRAKNQIRKMTKEEAAALVRAIGGDLAAKSFSELRRDPRVTPVTASPLQLTRIPTETAPTAMLSRQARAAPLPIAGATKRPTVAGSILAGLNGITDSLPLDIGNHLTAGINAIAHGNVLENPIRAYKNSLEAMREQDRFDRENHPIGRIVGKGAGVGAQVALLGPSLLGRAATARLAEASPLITSEILSLGGIGAAGGAGFQVVSDAVQRKRSSLPDLAGAAVGGAAGTYSALTGQPGMIGATTGGMTSAAQDVFNGRIRSFEDVPAAAERAMDAAAAGNVLAVAPGVALARKVRFAPPFSPNALLGKSKKQLGEGLSRVRSIFRMQKALPVKDVRLPVTNGYTKADSLTVPLFFWKKIEDIVEAKWGGAKSSTRQKAARREYINHRTDHFVPNDLGAPIEFPLGLGAYQWDPVDQHKIDERR